MEGFGGAEVVEGRIVADGFKDLFTAELQGAGQPVAADIDRDLREPGRKRLDVLDLRQTGASSQQRLLREIFRVRRIMGPAQAERVETLLLPAKEGVAGVAISLLSPLQ